MPKRHFAYLNSSATKKRHYVQIVWDQQLSAPGGDIHIGNFRVSCDSLYTTIVDMLLSDREVTETAAEG
jgi:hypothetical protein